MIPKEKVKRQHTKQIKYLQIIQFIGNIYTVHKDILQLINKEKNISINNGTTI